MNETLSRFYRRQFISVPPSNKRRRISLFGYVLFFLVAILIQAHLEPVFAADGDLDQSFGSHGKQVIQIAADQRDFAKTVAVQSDGKIVIGGELGDFGSDFNKSILIRLNANGSLDQSFGTGGKVINQAQLHLPALVIQPDGKIVTAGATGMVEINLNFAAVRYNADGTLDTTFGNGGYAVNGLGTASSIFLQPDGKVVVVGFVKVFRNGSDFVVARFNADGSPDQTFGSGGRVTTSFTSGLNSDDTARWAALQADGKIVVVGGITGTPAVLVRYNSNGSIDSSFGLEGSVISSSFNASARRLAIQPDGKLVVGGGTFVVARYDPGGHLDQNFGSSGRSSGGFGLGNGNLYALTLQADGKILIAGSVSYTNTGNSAFAVGRYNTNGTLDENFGQNGFVLTEFTGALDEAFGLTAQADGKILAAGYAAEPGASYHDVAIARYLSTAVALRRSPFDFDGDGKTDIGIFRPGFAEWWYTRSSDDRIRAAQFGAAADKITPGDFTGDSVADIAVWRPTTGFWFVLRSEDSSFYSFPFGQNGDVPVPADYDGDGKLDAAVFRPSTKTWFIQQSAGGIRTELFGTSNDLPVTADYDGDGKADIAIFRPNVGEWWINRSTAGLVAFQFGNGSDKPVQGDYTGDGKTDAAFFRSSTGFWYVLRSEDFSFYSVPFGSTGDIAASGDYDGDGKYDITVFRPSSSTWYINRTVAGTLITQFGAPGDQPIPNAFVP